LCEVDVVTVQSESLTAPQARCRKQTEEGAARMRRQRIDWLDRQRCVEKSVVRRGTVLGEGDDLVAAPVERVVPSAQGNDVTSGGPSQDAPQSRPRWRRAREREVEELAGVRPAAASAT
jgi:hypothetical protein